MLCEEDKGLQKDSGGWNREEGINMSNTYEVAMMSLA